MALTGLVALGGAGMQSTSTLLLQNTLNDHWRGAYDILVTATPQTLAPQKGVTFIPDATGTSRGTDTMSLDQLAAVRKLTGVDVAAPLGQVVVPADVVNEPVQLDIPLDGSKPGYEAYAITTVLTTKNGVTKPTTITRTLTYVVDQSAWTGYKAEAGYDPLLADSLVPRARAESARGRGIAESVDPSERIDPNRYLRSDSASPAETRIDLAVTPVQYGHIALVDPVAEKKLLGASGDFLDPLAAASAVIGSEPTGVVPDVAALKKSDDIDQLQSKGVLQNVSPILVRSDNTSDATLSVTMQKLAVTGGDASKFLEQWTSSKLPATTPVGTTSTLYDGTVGDALSPFNAHALTIDWPGYSPAAQPWYTEFPELAVDATGLRSVAPSFTTSAEADTDPLVATPFGYTNPWKVPSSFDMEPQSKPETPASEANYTATAAPLAEDGNDAFATTTPWSVGTYSAADLHASIDDLSYQALGYDELAPDKDGIAIPPSASGLGLNPDGADAIADIANAATWGVDSPVSSIRVRVGGITGYTEKDVDRIRAVATEIRGLGLTATVVAGSSPQQVSIAVRGYATQAANPSDDSANATVADAQTVTQDWAGLGAASAAKVGVSQSALVTLLLAAVAASALLVTVQLGSIPGRRGQSALLRQLGWNRRQRAGWIAAEEASGLLVLLALCALAAAVASQRTIVLGVAAATIGIALLAGAVIIVAGASPERGARRVRKTRVRWVVRSIRSFASRQAVTRWSVSLVTLLATGFLGVTGGFIVITIADTRQLAGSSRLGVFAITQALIPQSALLAITAAAAFTLIAVSRRRDAERDAQYDGSLTAMGWTPRQIASSRAISLLYAAAPALLVALALIGAATHDRDPRFVLLALGATALGCVASYLAATGRDLAPLVRNGSGRRRR